MKILRTIIAILLIGLLSVAGRYYMKYREKTIIHQVTKGVVTQLQTLQNLETAKMTITKIMEGENQVAELIPGIPLVTIIQNFLFRDKIVLEIEGQVRAGFDLSHITQESVIVHTDGSISIILPPAQILGSSLNENTKPFMRQLGVLTKGNVQLETQVRNNAIHTIEQEAIQAGILTIAESHAQQYLTELLQSLSITVKDIRIGTGVKIPLP